MIVGGCGPVKRDGDRKCLPKAIIGRVARGMPAGRADAASAPAMTAPTDRHARDRLEHTQRPRAGSKA